MNNQYATAYIMRALNQPTLEMPDPEQSNGTYDALYSLFAAHQSSGVIGAQRAWEVLKRMHPDLAQLNKAPSQPHLIHADQLRDLPQPTYALPDFAIYEHAFSLIIGKSGSRKSFLAVLIAGAIAQSAPVVYIAGEGLHGYASRWEAFKQIHKVDQAELYFYSENLQVMDMAQLVQFLTVIDGHKPALVVIDTLARAALGVEENSAREMGLFIAAVDQIRTTLNCGVVVVHHTGNNEKIRGSSALYAAADSVLSVVTEDDITTVYNDPDHGGKNKYAAAMPAKCFALLPVDDGAVLIPTERIQKTPDDLLPQNAVAILEALDGVPNMKPPAIIGATGLAKQTMYRNLKRLIQAGYVDQQDDGETYQITQQGTAYLSNLGE